MITLIGIATNPQERLWIERWCREHSSEVRLTELIFEGRLCLNDIRSYIEDSGLLARGADGFIIHTINLSNATFRALALQLQEARLKLVSTTGENDRPTWLP